MSDVPRLYHFILDHRNQDSPIGDLAIYFLDHPIVECEAGDEALVNDYYEVIRETLFLHYRFLDDSLSDGNASPDAFAALENATADYILKYLGDPR